MTPETLQKVINSPTTKKYNKRCYPVITWMKYGKPYNNFCVWNMNKGEMDTIEQITYGDICGMNFRYLCKIKEHEYQDGYIIWTRNSGKSFSLSDLSLCKFKCTRDLETIFERFDNPADGNTYINHYNLFCESLGQLVLQGDVDEIRIFKVEEIFKNTINIIRKDFLHNIDETEKSDVEKYKVVVTEENGEISKKWEPYDIDYLTMIQYV